MEQGLTAIALAEMSGTSEGRIFAIERGRFRPRPNEGAATAHALNQQPQRLFPNVTFDEPVTGMEKATTPTSWLIC